MQVNCDVMLKQFIAVKQSIEISESILFEELVVHDFEICIECEFSLIYFELIYFIIDFDTYDYKDTISYSEGYPVNKHIFYIWSKVEFPGKSGFWANI